MLMLVLFTPVLVLPMLVLSSFVAEDVVDTLMLLLLPLSMILLPALEVLAVVLLMLGVAAWIRSATRSIWQTAPRIRTGVGQQRACALCRRQCVHLNYASYSSAD